MMAGYHTDWAAAFPFAEVGLPDNYRRPLPSLWAFGFDYEPAWLTLNGNSLSSGVKLAEEDIARSAAASGLRPVVYRKTLRERYRTWLAEVRRTSPPTAQPGSGSAGR
jgi:hypothetical protein